jgi:hypothetical protein
LKETALDPAAGHFCPGIIPGSRHSSAVGIRTSTWLREGLAAALTIKGLQIFQSIKAQIFANEREFFRQRRRVR